MEANKSTAKLFFGKASGTKKRTALLRKLFSFYKNVVFPAQAVYSYLPANFRVKMFLYYSQIIASNFSILECIGNKLHWVNAGFFFFGFGGYLFCRQEKGIILRLSWKHINAFYFQIFIEIISSSKSQP